MAPQQRGYDFERFLQDLFNAFRLSAREPGGEILELRGIQEQQAVALEIGIG